MIYTINIITQMVEKGTITPEEGDKYIRENITGSIPVSDAVNMFKCGIWTLDKINEWVSRFRKQKGGIDFHNAITLMYANLITVTELRKIWHKNKENPPLNESNAKWLLDLGVVEREDVRRALKIGTFPYEGDADFSVTQQTNSQS